MDMRKEVCDLSGIGSSQSLNAGADLASNKSTEVCYSLFCNFEVSVIYFISLNRTMLHVQMGEYCLQH